MPQQPPFVPLRRDICFTAISPFTLFPPAPVQCLGLLLGYGTAIFPSLVLVVLPIRFLFLFFPFLFLFRCSFCS